MIHFLAHLLDISVSVTQKAALEVKRFLKNETPTAGQLRQNGLKEPTPRESDSNFPINKIGKNETPTPGQLRAKRVKESAPCDSDSRNRLTSNSGRHFCQEPEIIVTLYIIITK